MPYGTIEELPAEARKLPEQGQKIFLAAFNSAYSGTCKDRGADREACSFAVAWSAVKRKYTKEGDKWVMKEGAGEESANSFPLDFEIATAAKDKPLTISGPLIEIGALNLNGWGVGEGEVKAVIAGLEGVPLRICSGKESLKNEHSCDYDNQPKSDIGRIISASKKDGWIHATAEVTDSIASRKISEDTWPKHWSIFLSYKAAQEDGFITGVKPRSITLVRKPAYPGAEYVAGATKFEPPDAGDAPVEVKKILSEVYNSCRQKWVDSNPSDKENAGNKEGCAKRAWGAVENAGWYKNKEGRWEKKEGAAKGGDNTVNEYSEEEISKMLDWMKANPNKMTEAHKRMMYDVQGAKDRQQWMKDMLGEMNKNPGMIDDDMRTKMRDMMKASAGASLSNNNTEGHMKEGTEEKVYTQADLDKQLAAAKEEGRLEIEKAVAAAKAEAQEVTKGMMPRPEVEKLIAASVEQAKTATLDQIKKEGLISEVAALQVGAGVIKPEELEGAKKTLAMKSAAALEEDKALLLRVKNALEAAGVAAVNKFKETQLPASAGAGTSQGAAVGGWDPVKREWR